MITKEQVHLLNQVASEGELQEKDRAKVEKALKVLKESMVTLNITANRMEQVDMSNTPKDVAEKEFRNSEAVQACMKALEDDRSYMIELKLPWIGLDSIDRKGEWNFYSDDWSFEWSDLQKAIQEDFLPVHQEPVMEELDRLGTKYKLNKSQKFEILHKVLVLGT